MSGVITPAEARAEPRPGRPAAPPGLVLQRLLLDRPAPLRDLYWQASGRRGAAPVTVEAGALRLPAGTTLSFDTYFNALFEGAWQAAAQPGRLSLELDASGSLALRVARRVPEVGTVTLAECCLEAMDGPVTLDLPPPPAHPRAAGRVFLEVTALAPGATLRAARWRCPDAVPAPVGLALVFCTFNREADLARVLASIAADAEALAAVARIFVVNQGRPGLAAHPAMAGLPARLRQRLEVIEQGNFGGVGGFTRGMLAAREMPGATHVLLMDDDVVLEPESLRRAAAFFAIARPDTALGGHMLDLLQPTRLYEAGARINPGNWALEPLRFHLAIARRGGLDALHQPEPMHYNGWWMFGLPLAMLDRAGLPLPCFIRGDDVEFGRRLHDAGIHTASLPGIAVWHEPFYMRLGGWQLYYETRNMLIAAALHFPRSGRGLAVLLLKRLLGQLLTYRYYSAALILRGAEDYLRGPAVLEEAPWALHASLEREKERFPPVTVAAEQVAPPLRPGPDPRGRARYFARLARAMLRNTLRPAPAAPAAVRVPIGDLVWFRLMRHDLVVADTGWETRLPAFRRDRAAFRSLLAEGLRLALRLAREAAPVGAAWQAARPRLTSPAFWRSYLGIDPAGD
ncbi:glycosyltransferase [Belnapia sp. T6]|uniref:Glycosyltransferase n=1 Tax=Belnapia mucosa TaxID=2804532 RepID=A0ABS1V9M1_9PROT|nr:glycosyltransferase [Belnapia mucosa]MBL6458345.1 glycosyltransferase [Belnapia mucosa]